MSIQEISSKLKGLFQNVEYMLTLLIIVVSLTSFYLGRLSVSQKAIPQGQESSIIQNDSEKVILEAETNEFASQNVSTSTSNNAGYVASKSGTKYHLPWCPGAKQIKESNKIFFETKEEAEKAGYGPASNCKGI